MEDAALDERLVMAGFKPNNPSLFAAQMVGSMDAQMDFLK